MSVMELKTMKHCSRVDLWPGAFAWKDILFARDWRQQNSCFHGFPRPMKRKVFICLIEFFFLDKRRKQKEKRSSRWDWREVHEFNYYLILSLSLLIFDCVTTIIFLLNQKVQQNIAKLSSVNRDILPHRQDCFFVIFLDGKEKQNEIFPIRYSFRWKKPERNE